MWRVEGIDVFLCFSAISVECFIINCEETGDGGGGCCSAILDYGLLLFIEEGIEVVHEVGESLEEHPLSVHCVWIIESGCQDLVPVRSQFEVGLTVLKAVSLADSCCFFGIGIHVLQG